MKVIISGLTAAGKTTHSHLVAKEFGFSYISGSSLLIEKYQGKTAKHPLDYWITDESFALDKERMKNPSQDVEIEKSLINVLENKDENIIFDTWALPWESQYPALRIWLESSIKSRSLKALVSFKGTSQFTIDEIYSRIAVRDHNTCNFFLHHFGLDIKNDHKPFDVILDISDFIAEATPISSSASISSVQKIISLIIRWRLNLLENSDIINCLRSFPPKTFVRLPDRLTSLNY